MEIIFSFVQRMMLKTLIQVYLTFVQELVYWYRCETLTCNATAAYGRRTDSCSATYKHCTAILKHQVLHICQIDFCESFQRRTLHKTKIKLCLLREL